MKVPNLIITLLIITRILILILLEPLLTILIIIQFIIMKIMFLIVIMHVATYALNILQLKARKTLYLETLIKENEKRNSQNV